MLRLLCVFAFFYVSDGFSDPNQIKDAEGKISATLIPDAIRAKIKSGLDVEDSSDLTNFLKKTAGKKILDEQAPKSGLKGNEKEKDFGGDAPLSKDGTTPVAATPSAQPQSIEGEAAPTNTAVSENPNRTNGANTPNGELGGPTTGNTGAPNGFPQGSGPSRGLTEQESVDRAIAERAQQIETEVRRNYEQASSNWKKPLSENEVANLRRLGDSLSTGAHGTTVQEQTLDGRYPTGDRLVEEGTPGAVTINYYIGSIEQASDEALIALARNALASEGSSGDATRAELETLVGLLRSQTPAPTPKDSGVRKYEEITSAPARAMTDAQDTALATLISKVEKAVDAKRAVALPNQAVVVGAGKEFKKKEKAKLSPSLMVAELDPKAVLAPAKKSSAKMSADLIPGLMAALRQRAALLKKKVVKVDTPKKPSTKSVEVQIASIPTPSLQAARKGLAKVRSLGSHYSLWIMLFSVLSLLFIGYKKNRKRAVNRELT